MQNTKKTILALSLAAATAATSLAQQIDLVSLGSPTFTVVPEFTDAAYTQNTSGVLFNGAMGISAQLTGTFSPLNWSAYTTPPYTFGIVMSLTGTNPDLPFSVLFLDSQFNDINTYSGTTSGASTSSFQLLTLTTAGTGILSDVAGIQFTWDGSGTVNANIEKIAAVVAVPEPSTYALITLAGLALGGYALRRRQRA